MPELDPPTEIPVDALRGQTILITRPAAQAQRLVEKFESVGAQTLVQPVIEIQPLGGADEHTLRIRQLGGQLEQGHCDFGRLIVTSKNGVEHLFAAWEPFRIPAAVWESLGWCAIGEATADHLATALQHATGIDAAEWRLRTEFPPQSNSESLADWLIDVERSDSHSKAESKPWLIVRGDRGSHTLASRLSAEKIEFTEVVVYRSVDCQEIDASVQTALNAQTIDWVTLTSSAIARSSAKLFQAWLDEPDSRLRAVSISPKTSAAFQECGYRVAAEASEYNLDGVVAAVVASP